MVTDEFNPYLQWLGLADSSPSYYELLGLEDETEDARRIAAAADRAIARVRSHRPGPHTARWSQLLDELKLVKQVLTDPRRKQEYDTTLRSARNKGTGKPLRPRQGNAVFPKTPTADHTPDNNDSRIGSTGAIAASLPEISLEGLIPPGAPRPNAPGKSPVGGDSSSEASSSLGIDLSYLSPKSAPPRKAPPREQGLVAIPAEELEQLDDIVLPPTARKASPGPPAEQRTDTPGERPSTPLVRANPALLAAKRRRKAGSSTPRGIVSGVMSLLLIALGIYIFLIFEDPTVDEASGRATSSAPARPTLLSDEQQAAILEENERRERAEEETETTDVVTPNSPPIEIPLEDVVEPPGSGTDEPLAERPAGEETSATAMPAEMAVGKDSDSVSVVERTPTPPGDASSVPENVVERSPEQKLADSNLPIAESATAANEPTDDFDSLCGEIRLALSEHRLDDATSVIARAHPLALLPKQEAQVAGLQQLTDLLREFRAAVDRAISTMEAGTSFPISDNHEVVVVERLPDAIRIRMAGENHLFPLTDLPLRLGLRLAERGVPPGPRAKLVLGAFQWTHKRALPQHRTEVRQWWLEAQEAGEDVTHLLLILDDSIR
jgi:hypothetical protein